MAEVEIEHEDFDCPKMGAVVKITREARIHSRLDQDELVLRSPHPAVNCESKKECGVGTLSGSRWDFDWTKCVTHPDFKG